MLDQVIEAIKSGKTPAYVVVNAPAFVPYARSLLKHKYPDAKLSDVRFVTSRDVDKGTLNGIEPGRVFVDHFAAGVE